MKYKVLETCHTGGRFCRKGTIVEFPEEVVNEYLEPITEKQIKEEKEKEVKVKPKQALKDLGKKEEITTGMAAKRKDE